MVLTYSKVQINRVRLPILFVVSCVHMRAYNCTCTRRVQTTTHLGHKHTVQPRHKRMYIHANLQRYTRTSLALVYTTCVAQAVHTKYCTGTSTACEPKHANLRTIGASSRLSVPEHCTSTARTYKHKHSCTLRTSPRLSMQSPALYGCSEAGRP